MEIPKYLQKQLDRRERLAQELMAVSNSVDEWIEDHGGNLQDRDIADAVLTGCMMYCEPATAKKVVMKYIENL